MHGVTKRTKWIDKGKSYRRNLLKLRGLRSGDGGLGSRDGLGRVGFLHSDNGGSNFRGRHYSNRGKLELEWTQINRDE